MPNIVGQRHVSCHRSIEKCREKNRPRQRFRDVAQLFPENLDGSPRQRFRDVAQLFPENLDGSIIQFDPRVCPVLVIRIDECRARPTTGRINCGLRPFDFQRKYITGQKFSVAIKTVESDIELMVPQEGMLVRRCLQNSERSQAIILTIY